MPFNPIRIRRSNVNIGANDAQADEFTEAASKRFDNLLTKDDLYKGTDTFKQRVVRRLSIAMIGMAAVIIGATALLTQV